MARRTKRSSQQVHQDSNYVPPQNRKQFHIKDLIQYQPLTPQQKLLYQLWEDYPETSLFLKGSAGTGKTFLSLFLSLKTLLEKEYNYDKIVIVRSVVSSRDIGFLPGSEEEKVQVYEQPYISILNELFPFKNGYENLKKIGKIEFVPSSYLRGTTFNNCIVIVDEAQNMSFQELSTIVTRCGQDCKMVFCGDSKQNDLHYKRNDVSGFDDFFKIIQKMQKYFDIVEFTHDDIVRSGLVKDFIVQQDLLGL